MIKLKPIRAVLLLAALSLAACAQGSNDPSLTPQQRAMREQAGRWNSTVATGALVGAAGGAALGAAVGGRNRGTAALIGGGIGLVGGLAAGTMVANRNMAFENREAPIQDRIKDAQQRTAALQQSAQTANELTATNLSKLEELDGQFRRGQLSAAAFRQQAQSMRADVELMRSEQSGALTIANSFASNTQSVPQFRAEETKAREAMLSIQRSADQLENRLARVPAA